MKELKILIIVNIFCVSAMMAFLSVVGPITRELNLQEWHAGITVAIAGVLWVFFARYWGKKSDKAGRKPILFLGVLGVAIGYLLLAVFVDHAIVSPPAIIISIGVLVITRGIIGIFYAAITPVSNALIADEVEEKHRTPYIAKLGAANGIGMVIGPALGGVLAVYGLSTPLYAFAILPLIAAGLIFLFIPTVKIQQTKEPAVPKILDPRLRMSMLAAFLTMYVVVTSQVCLGFFVIDILGLNMIKSAQVTGYILSIVGASFVVAQIFVSKFKEVTPVHWLQYGAFIAMIGFIAVSLSTTKLFLTLAFCVAAFGMGFIFPAFQTLAVNSVTKEEKGAASGTVSAAQGIGMIAGPLASTFLYELSPVVPFAVAAFAFGGLLLISFKELRKSRIQSFVK